MRYQPLLASLEPFGRELLIAIARQLRRTFPAEKPAFDRLIVEITQSGTVFGDGSLVY
jgi:hypothetical protein